MRNVIIIGGGLSGLVSGIQLAKAGIPCTIIEKKSYPLHRVCGEYVSNEAFPFLKNSGLYPSQFGPPNIDELVLSSVRGKSSRMPLDLGGFGISRFSFDFFLYQKAVEHGVDFLLNTEVSGVTFFDEKFEITAGQKKIVADVVIGAYGKRSKVDISLQRNFIKQRSPFVGVKYHVRTGYNRNQIALHNFDGGYCGINGVEDGIVNVCYLSSSENLKRYGSIEAMEKNVLFKNPHLRKLFTDADFLFDKPEVISEISFETKSPVEKHILMAGDSAGMITPLCGNGMAMAIHAGKIAADIISTFMDAKISRGQMEKQYATQWNEMFSARLWRGRMMQKLFGNQMLSDAAVNLVLYSQPLARILVRNTHGSPF